jgi:hypothetical protein
MGDFNYWLTTIDSVRRGVGERLVLNRCVKTVGKRREMIEVSEILREGSQTQVYV